MKIMSRITKYEYIIFLIAHCAGGDGPGPDQVRLGDYDFKYTGDTNEQTFSVAWIKLHERYNKNNDENDIAIIKLNRPVRYTT